MSHGLSEVRLQSTRHEIILHSLWKVISERQVILHDPAVKSTVLMVQNGRKCIYILLLYTKTIVDLCFGGHGVLLNTEVQNVRQKVGLHPLNNNDFKEYGMKSFDGLDMEFKPIKYCDAIHHNYLNCKQQKS